MPGTPRIAGDSDALRTGRPAPPAGPVTAASTGSVGLVKVPWDDGRCIFCSATGRMTDGHVIPRAAGGRLSAPFECAQCNGRLGSSVEARLVSDPAMRLAVEALGARIGNPGFVGRFWL